MSDNYKPFKNFKQMIRQPSSRHWFARDKLTTEQGFGGKKSKKYKEIYPEAKTKALENANK